MSKTKARRSAQDSGAAGKLADRVVEEPPRIEPAPPPKRPAMLALSLLLLAAWILFLLLMAFGGLNGN
jgi:hypothetical protein